MFGFQDWTHVRVLIRVEDLLVTLSVQSIAFKLPDVLEPLEMGVV